MRATDELRQILDEHGVKWRRGEKWWAVDSCIDRDAVTVWRTGKILWTAVEGEGGVWLDATTAGEKPIKPYDAAKTIMRLGKCAEINTLEYQNAKLRELVRFMWLEDYAGHFSTLTEHQEHRAAVWQRICELGVEVHG